MNNHAVCLSLVLFLLCPSLRAQWVPTGGPEGGEITSVAASGAMVFAGGVGLLGGLQVRCEGGVGRRRRGRSVSRAKCARTQRQHDAKAEGS